jgi:hypothetical protein
MVRSRKKSTVPETELLTPSNKSALLDQRQELEDTLKEVDNFGQGTSAEQLDKENIKRQIRRIDNAIESRSVPEPKGKEKDSFIRECVQLEERFKQGLPTKYEMDHPAKCPGAVRKHMAWLERNKQHIKRWRYLQNVVNPDNPKSIEELREGGKPRY